MSKEDLRKMIINNQWEEVFKALHEITRRNSVLFQEVGVLETRFNDFKSKETTGELSHQEQTQGKSQLARGLLNIVDQLQDDGTITPKVPPNTQPSTKKLEAKPMHPNVNIPYWIAGGVGLILVFWALRPLIFQAKTPDFQSVVINLHGPQGILDNPLTKGIVSVAAVDANFRDQAPLGADGHAVFDSVPIALLGKKMVFSLSSSPDYVLKNPNEKYILAEKINVEVNPTKGDDPGTDPPPIFKRFLGIWQNINSETQSTHLLEISQHGNAAKIRVRSKCCELTYASPRSITANRLTLDDFDYYTNHYSNFSIGTLSSNLLICNYTAKLENGQVFQAQDTLRKQQ